MGPLRKTRKTDTWASFPVIARRCPRRQRTTGFILLELIIVLVLISVIIGLAAIFYANSLPSYKFNATIRNISSTIKQARSLAKIHDEIQTVTIDMESKKYALEGHTPKDIPEGIAVKIIDPVSGEIQTGKYHFVLYPTGGIQGGTIVLWDAKRSVSIQLDPVVGTVVIK
jgi:type II secretory pathway pseudopilin PulG